MPTFYDTHAHLDYHDFASDLPQVIERADNPLYHDILTAFEGATGLAALVNTSFNVHEEPIVCFPENAVQALAEDRIDCLALGSYWSEK